MLKFSTDGVDKLYIDFLSDLTIKKVYSVSTMYTKKNTSAKRQNRPSWALVIKYEGKTIYTSRDKEYVSDINNIAVLPKGCDYNWCCTQSGHFTIIEFECDKSYSDIFSFNVKNGELFLKTIKKMEINRALRKPMYMLDELRDLYGLISSLLKSSEKYLPSDKKQKILPAIEYIVQNCNKSIYNDELAAVAGISTVYFRKLFKETMGVSPAKYVKLIKMKKAEEMLKSDYSRITDIGYSLGYNNVYDFSRDFKKFIGISPLKYAKANAHL